MKSGASDPFADDGPEDEPETDEPQSESERDELSDSGDGRSATATIPASVNPADTSSSDRPSTEDSTDVADAGNGLSRSELPFVLRRERVKDERPEVHQLFVQQDTHERAISAERQLQDRLDDDLARTDAREAIYRAGMKHLDDAEEVLRNWGYDL